jgi:hypothetical protein
MIELTLKAVAVAALALSSSGIVAGFIGQRRNRSENLTIEVPIEGRNVAISVRPDASVADIEQEIRAQLAKLDSTTVADAADPEAEGHLA